MREKSATAQLQADLCWRMRSHLATRGALTPPSITKRRRNAPTTRHTCQNKGAWLSMDDARGHGRNDQGDMTNNQLTEAEVDMSPCTAQTAVAVQCDCRAGLSLSSWRLESSVAFPTLCLQVRGFTLSHLFFDVGVKRKTELHFSSKKHARRTAEGSQRGLGVSEGCSRAAVERA
jgi:hypothetical protein